MFRQSLARSHNAGGVDRLVGRDHHHAFRCELVRQISHIAGCDNDVLDRFAGVDLQQRHVFVGGRVKDNFRAVLLKDGAQPLNVGQIRQKRLKLDPGIETPHFTLQKELTGLRAVD